MERDRQDEPTAGGGPSRSRSVPPAGVHRSLTRGLEHADSLMYVPLAALLLVAAGFTIVGTVIDVIRGSDARAITDTGVFILERALLLFIIAELLYTLRLVDAGGRILVEPFLFIGLIAVVRRLLVVTAEAEVRDGRSQMVQFAIEIGAVAGVGLVLALAIHLLRGSAGEQP
ncbi:MAG: hypothetical protein QOH46_3116 [Solirubrobacteraceae bacterium]|jgi:uncharacterized membrane protein (DUF373 family)|nr:hypothetical protein [Solirubrobacteraceae bacterium]MEA2248587.1 hypothetical protein [Solirubrobacteraceae bacterium]